MKNPCTYDDWWKGKITLATTPYIALKTKSPVIVTWKDIFKPDILKIKKKQEELFFKAVKQKTSQLKSQFDKRFKNSKMKIRFLDKQLIAIHNILFVPFENNGTRVNFNSLDISFDPDRLDHIQSYARRTIEDGKEDGYDFMPSPNSHFQDRRTVIDQVYAHALFDFNDSLKIIRLKEKEKNNKELPNKVLAELRTYTNEFDRVEIDKVITYFKSVLFDPGYLAQDEFKDYIKMAFQDQKIPRIRFKLNTSPKKASITSKFYRYFKNVAIKPHSKARQYAMLLGEYFEGYKTDNVLSNFSRLD